MTDQITYDSIVYNNVSMKFERMGTNQMNDTKTLVDKHGFSKYKIAKLVGVSWNTVSFWYKGVFSPKKEHLEKIKAIFPVE